jgi:probable F420-dependent oxidoreductase
MVGSQRLPEFQALARRAAAAGFPGLVITESGRTAYLACAAAALCGAELDIATGVAVAFPRSPMVTASTAWELADASGGRFRLGIGPQVRAHVERRYSADFDPPGPRMRDYVLAVKAIFRAFRGEPLAHEGPYYTHTLLPAMWSPGALAYPDPPVDVAAVNPWMLRMAGEHADGVHVHPINTPTYYRETLLPNIKASGRDLSSFALFVPLFTAVGDTDEEQSRGREASRTMVGFYGSTPNYAFIFDQLGFEGTTEKLRAAQKAGDIAGMSAAISDDLLAHFTVEGTWDELPTRIAERCAPLAGHDVQPVLYLAGQAAQSTGDTFERYGDVARRAAALPAGTPPASGIRRPAGAPPQPERPEAVLEFLTRDQAGFTTKRLLDGLRFEATDADWSHGEGALVRGSADSLRGILSGESTDLHGLEGDGVAILRSRLS